MRAISRNMIRSLCVLGIGYLGLYLGHPHSALADMGCSNATLKGTYTNLAIITVTCVRN
jgi:hypothetical protein